MDASKAKKEASEIKKARCVILNLHLSACPLILAYYPVFCATVNLFFGKYLAFGIETGFKLDSI